MKTLRMILAIALFLAGTVASTVPLLAASHAPLAPTTLSAPSNDPVDCSSGC